MKQRCLNPNNPSYKNYGGRGIKICTRWFKFKNFFEDMGQRPCGYEIDRIDVNGDYKLENCRWVPRLINAQNKRASRYIKIDGVTKRVTEWAKEFGVDPYLVHQRISRDGLDFKKALTINVSRKRPNLVEIAKNRTVMFVRLNDKRIPLIEACRKLDLNYKVIYQRIKRDKMDPEKALAFVYDRKIK